MFSRGARFATTWWPATTGRRADRPSTIAYRPWSRGAIRELDRWPMIDHEEQMMAATIRVE